MKIIAPIFYYFQLDEASDELRKQISDKPFVDKRIRLSYDFLEDVKSNIQILSDSYKNKTLQEFIDKNPTHSFQCRKANLFENRLLNSDEIEIWCKVYFKKISEFKDQINPLGYVTEDNDKIVVHIFEFLLIKKQQDELGSYGVDIQTLPAQSYLNNIINKLDPKFSYSSVWSHKFQHLMQCLHNRCCELKYKFNQADLKDPDVYFNSTIEREAFFISILSHILSNKPISTYENLKKDFQHDMFEFGVPLKHFCAFEDPLRCYFTYSQNKKESKINQELTDFIDKFYENDAEQILDRSMELIKMSHDERKQAWDFCVRQGFSFIKNHHR